MAKRSGKRPAYSISASVAVRRGKYKQLGSFGLWVNDGKGPMARGSVKDEYLEELAANLQKAVDNEQSVSFSLFKNKPVKSRDDDDDEDEDEDEEDEEEEEEDDEEDEDEDDEEEEKPAKRKAKKSKKSSGKKGGKGKKKSNWDFDDEDDD